MLRCLYGVLALGVMLCVGAAEAEAFGANYRGPFEGRVVDAETGEPIHGTVVFVKWVVRRIGMDSFFDTDEVVTDQQGKFSVPKNWSWNPLRTLSMDSEVLILKAGYWYQKTHHWGLIAEAKAILAMVSPAEREEPGAGCDRAMGDSAIKQILGCPGSGSRRQVEDGYTVFYLTMNRERLTQQTQDLDTFIRDVPISKQRLLQEEIARDRLRSIYKEEGSTGIGHEGGVGKVPFPDGRKVPGQETGLP